MGVIGGLRVSNESYEDERLNVCNCGLSGALRETSALCNWSEFTTHTLSFVAKQNLFKVDLKIHHYLLSPSITARMAQYWTSLIWQKASPIILSDNDTFDPLRDWDLPEVGTLWQQDESPALGVFRILMSSGKEGDDDVLAFQKYGHLARIGVKG